MFEKAFEPIKFVCAKCGLERRGSEPKKCVHLYYDYKIKKLAQENEKVEAVGQQSP
jgi:hypothetical protein